MNSNRIHCISMAVGLGAATSILAFSPGCSDTDDGFIPVGQFDDGIFEITGPNKELLGRIFAHTPKITRRDGTTVIDYNNSSEVWVVDGTYCSSDQTAACPHKSLTFTYITKMDYQRWRDGAQFNLNNPRIYQATYQTRDVTLGLTGCDKKQSCIFTPDTGVTTDASMFPANKQYKKGMDVLPLVLVHNNGTSTTETWFMNEFFNNTTGAWAGVALSDAVNAAVTGTEIDCKACEAKIRVSVQYKKLGTLPAGL
ncbi:MAG TPA: hypothetical protein PKA58_24335 [Polyangium sp.]|nr:hypothetical protein [Polyangium sp.]